MELAPALGLVGLLFVLAALGDGGWRWLQSRRSGADAAEGERPALPSIGTGAWADAACPPCLAISLVGEELS